MDREISLPLTPTNFYLNKYEKLGKNISTYGTKRYEIWESSGKLIMLKKCKYPDSYVELESHMTKKASC